MCLGAAEVPQRRDSRGLQLTAVGRAVVGCSRGSRGVSQGAGFFLRIEARPVALSSTTRFDVLLPFLDRHVRSPPLFARDDVAGVPVRPVMLRRARFVRAMPLLCLAKKRGQIRDIQVAESPPG